MKTFAVKSRRLGFKPARSNASRRSPAPIRGRSQPAVIREILRGSVLQAKFGAAGGNDFQQQIPFGGGESSLDTSEGKPLSPFSQAGPVQQGGAAAPLQHQAACSQRAEGEIAQSRGASGVLAQNVVWDAAGRSLVVQDFPVNGADVPPGTRADKSWQRAMSWFSGDPSIRFMNWGYADCHGVQTWNRRLGDLRVQSVMEAMPSAVRRKHIVTYSTGGSLYRTPNHTAEERARNRAVYIAFRQTAVGGIAPCDRLNRVSDIDEYLFLVRCAEKRLGLTGPNRAPETLSVLRQIYYGSPSWSKNPNRIWDDVITQRPWKPGSNPEPRLGKSLFQALKSSNVVDKTDIGHLLAGLDAMIRPQPVTLSLGPVSFSTAIVNEEWATWAGDVGSAAAYYAVDEAHRNRTGNYDDYFRRWASDADLFGNIDAFAIRVGMSPTAAATLTSPVRLTQPLSEILVRYYRLTSTDIGRARETRIRDFLIGYGAVLRGRTLANPALVTARMQQSVGPFARLFAAKPFLEQWKKTGALPKPQPGQPNPSALMTTAVGEMTKRFVAWLVNQGNLK